ncbi:hypothetical protein [Streptomyces fulvoviolaceus]|nr:hypothetical protein [Streptomyces fulvoviolaceus]MCT9077215.1 hypothetical protein [Streptomyces fulvoviolaceus]
MSWAPAVAVLAAHGLADTWRVAADRRAVSKGVWFECRAAAVDRAGLA